MLYASIDSPLGELLLVGEAEALHGLYLQQGRKRATVRSGWRHEPDAFAEVRRQLEEYFAGRRTTFELALETSGTPFQRRVWQALQEIPYGETRSYGELAGRLGRPAAARAVGAANGANPIAVVIPCHRLIGTNGALTGYGSGIERKSWLLELESRSVAVSA